MKDSLGAISNMFGLMMIGAVATTGFKAMSDMFKIK